MTDTPERELIETEPCAFLKMWLSEDGGYRVRVDLGAECEPWLQDLNPTITPLYTRDAIKVLLLRVDKLEEALNAIIDRAPERDIKWAGMTARDIAIHTLNRSAD